MAEPHENKGMQHPAFQAQKWKPGQSGNPAGKPKGKSFMEWANEVAEEQVKGSEMTKMEFAVRVFFEEVMKRNPRFFVEFLARFAPVPLRHEVGGLNGGPITLAQWIQGAREEPPQVNFGGSPAPTEPPIPTKEAGVEDKVRLREEGDE